MPKPLRTGGRKMNIALIAQDRKKDEMVRFAIAYKHLLKNHRLYATGTTGKRIAEATGLPVHRFLSGPLGGDQQIGAKVAENEMDCIIFLRDPLTAQDRKSTRLNSSHVKISYAVFCLKKKITNQIE